MRINRYIASCTKYSRRQAEAFVRRGQIKINGEVVNDLARQIGLHDKIQLNEETITPINKVYYVINKPIGYVSSVEDKHAEKLVIEIVPDNPPVFPVGRLDKDSKGLMILTNDGELAFKLTHPKFEKEKEYLVTLDKLIDDKTQGILLSGIKLEEGVGKFDKISKIDNKVYKVVLHQGYNRQIREMLGSLDVRVKSLQRIRIAGIKLLDLAEGKYRKISQCDIEKMVE